METFDTLRPNNTVTVTIWGPDNSRLYESTQTGYHTIEDAIKGAISNADLEVDPKDCVFEVTNQDTKVSHKYRLNAHDNLKLIV